MLELAAYFALVQVLNAIYAAVILGLVNFAIAAILFALAGKAPAGRELELASEIHAASLEALQLDARTAQAELSGKINHPLNGILPSLVVTLITINLRS